MMGKVQNNKAWFLVLPVLLLERLVVLKLVKLVQLVLLVSLPIGF